MKRPRASRDELANRAALHDARVEYVADLMRTLRFKSGATTKALAYEWNLPLKAAGQIAVEASRRVRAECGDHDETHALAVLDRVIDEALIARDFRTAIGACQLLATISGAGAPTGVQVEALKNLTPERIKTRKREIIARLTAKASGGDPP